MLQQRQLQQRGQIAHQLRGDDEHQNGDQHRAEGNRLQAFHALHSGRHVPQGDVFQEAKGRMDFRPQHNHRQQRDQHQDRAHQPQRLGTDGVEIHLADVHIDRAFGAGHSVRIFFTPRALSEDLRPAMLGAIKGQTATLDQHPATDDVIHHQQQEPDSD